jgi:hypothetical protein
MRGQILINFNDDDGFGGDYLDIYTNSVLRKRIYVNSNKLYSCPVYVGDVVTFDFNNLSPYVFRYLVLDRTDYTTDDVDGDRGIKTTNIVNGLLFDTYTFTATTVNTAYDFDYVFQNTNIVQYQILTENSNPLMTENNDYINQQY